MRQRSGYRLQLIFIAEKTGTRRNNMKMFIDDNVIIPDEIKKMSAEELKKAIQELEQELKERKQVS